jgi:ssDNA-binding Zn-finger/Zn-ribbon topoisomerase 1
MKCPDCGFKKEIKINNLYNKGFSCPKCGDKTPYPEKIMFSIFDQLKIDFKTQLSKAILKWCKDYKYDFYFKLDDNYVLIETHGEQHYKENRRIGARTLEEEKRNDILKKELALTNGIKEENYIVIDCRKSELEFIKQNILVSRLNELFDLSKVDWLEAEKFALSNRVKEACSYWSNGITNSQEIAKIMKLARNTITKYLKKGSILNWCNYDAEEVKKKNGKISSMKSRKPVVILKNNLIIKKFESFIELERMSQRIFGTKLDYNMISQVCVGKKPQYKGYTFKYLSDLTPEELQQLEQSQEIQAI